MKTNPYIIGVDVASQKADIDIHDADDNELGQFVMKTNNYNINNTLSKISTLVDKKNTIVIVEATGPYHRIFYYAFLNSGFQVTLITPYQSNAFQKASSLRKTTTDKISAHALANIYRLHQFSPKSNFEAHIELKKLARAYYTLIDDQSNFKKRIKSILSEIFPLFTSVFKNPFLKTPITLLNSYPTPTELLKENPKILFELMKNTARKNAHWTIHKLDSITSAAILSPSVEKGKNANILALKIFITTIQNLEAQIQNLKQQIKKLSKDYPQIKLLMSIPGIGPILAATILGEIGDFSAFNKPAQLTAFAGIDPSVKQSGKFKGSKNRMSKRGSKLLRRALYLAACASIRKNRTGNLNNPYLREYYDKKVSQGKPKKVALGACMNKIAGYIFATLRDNKRFILVDPKNHRLYKKAA